MKKGLVIIATGQGKGKTTAALGMALRAVGWQKNVLIIQFLKKGDYGEVKALKKIPKIVIRQFGRKKFANLKNPGRQDKKIAREAVDFSRRSISSQKYDLIILDEIIVASTYNLITKKSVIELIDMKPKELDLVLTGRGADKKLIEKADLVSKIENIKHPFQKGIAAKKGIEY